MEKTTAYYLHIFREIIVGFLIAILIPLLTHQGVTTFLEKPDLVTNAEKKERELSQKSSILENERREIFFDTRQLNDLEESLKQPQTPWTEATITNGLKTLITTNQELNTNNEKINAINTNLLPINQELRKENSIISNWENHKTTMHLSALIIIGTLAVALSYFFGITSIGLGIGSGGAISILSGYMLYWRWINDLVIFFSLLAAFIMLIFVWVMFMRKEYVILENN